jgi:hypothetical protein
MGRHVGSGLGEYIQFLALNHHGKQDQEKNKDIFHKTKPPLREADL